MCTCVCVCVYVCHSPQDIALKLKEKDNKKLMETYNFLQVRTLQHRMGQAALHRHRIVYSLETF